MGSRARADRCDSRLIRQHKRFRGRIEMKGPASWRRSRSAFVVKLRRHAGAAAPWIVSDELWELVEPLLPRKERRFSLPGTQAAARPASAAGILFVLHTGIALAAPAGRARLRLGCDLLPAPSTSGRAPGCGRGCTRLLTRACARQARSSGRERSPTPARCRRMGAETGPCPVDRGVGSKHRLLVDATGDSSRLAAERGNRNDILQLIPLLDAVPAVGASPAAAPTTRQRDRRPRLRPRALPGRAPPARIPTRGRPPQGKARLRPGPVRWVVERTFAWLHNLKRLLVRYDRRAEIRKPSSPSAAASSASGGFDAHSDSTS